MEVKLKFNDINVKEEKEKTLVKVLMLKGEKGDTTSAEWGTITGTLNDQTDLKNALDSKANQTETTQALNSKANASDLNNYYTKSQMDTSLASKLGTEDIEDSLTSSSADKVLSANQGKILNEKIAKKPYYFNSISEMKSYNLQTGDMAITKGYYEANDGGAGTYEVVTGNLTEDGGSIHEITNGLYAKLVIENETINIKQFGAKGDGTTDDTLKISNAFNFGGNIIIPFGIYAISNTIYINDDTFVEMSKDAKIYLKDDSKCVMFMTTNAAHKNISWCGGTLDGNDAGQHDTSTGTINDFTNAFRFYNVENLIVENVNVEHIHGHGIEHWGCNNAKFDNIYFQQAIDTTNFPNGGSRRDGITGCSSNLIISNIHGFTDDDMIAIVCGAEWHDNTVKDLENIVISNIYPEYSKDDNTHPTFSAVRINALNSTTLKNVVVKNVFGTTKTFALRFGGYDIYKDGTLSNINVSNINIKCYNNFDNEGLIKITQAYITDIYFNKVLGSNASNKTPVLFNIQNCGIDRICIDNCELKPIDIQVTGSILYIRCEQNTGGVAEGVSQDIKHIILKNIIFDYTVSNSSLIRTLGSYVQTAPIRLEIINPTYNSTLYKYTINNSNNTPYSINSPSCRINQNLLNVQNQKDGDLVLTNNDQLLFYINNTSNNLLA